MKKFLIVLTVFTLCISCSSDDDNTDDSNEEPASIVGSWILNSLTTPNTLDLNGDGQGSNDLIEETGCLQSETLVFEADNTGTAFSMSFLDIFVENGMTQVVDCVVENEADEFTWTMDGNVVTINDQGTSFNGAINGDNFSIMVPGGFELEVLQGDTVVLLNLDVTFSYRRL